MRAEIDKRKARVVFVHQGDAAHGDTLAEAFKIGDWAHIADPERGLYRTFGLEEGGVTAVVGPKALLRGAALFFSSGILPKKPVGSIRQMPGVFVLRGGRIAAEFRHRSVSDRPGYLALLDRAASA